MSHLRFALVQKLHSSDECNPKSSKQDEDLVPVLVLGSVVGRKEYQWNPEDPGVGDDIRHSNKELPQIRISGVQFGGPGDEHGCSGGTGVRDVVGEKKRRLGYRPDGEEDVGQDHHKLQAHDQPVELSGAICDHAPC